MPKLIKRAVVIQDLIDIATYISQDNLDAGDRFLYATEATFQQIAKLPSIGRFSGFTHPKLTQVRQFPVKGFKNYLIDYSLHKLVVNKESCESLSLTGKLFHNPNRIAISSPRRHHRHHACLSRLSKHSHYSPARTRRRRPSIIPTLPIQEPFTDAR